MADVKYAISIKDGRLVYATSEVAQNPTYFVLHPDTVLAIQKGELTANQVLVFIKNRPRTSEEIARLRPENVRQTELAKPDPTVTSETGIKVPVSDQTVANGTLTESTVDGAAPVGIPSKSALTAMKVDDLRAMATSKGVSADEMTKAQIIDALTGAAV